MSVLRSYQAEHGPDFPWSVGKDGPGVESRGGKDDPDGELRAFSPSAGEDMSAEGRRQLALFLVSSRGSRRGEGLQGEAYQSCCRILERVGGWVVPRGSRPALTCPAFLLRPGSIYTTLRPHTAPHSQPSTSRCPGTSRETRGYFCDSPDVGVYRLGSGTSPLPLTSCTAPSSTWTH